MAAATKLPARFRLTPAWPVSILNRMGKTARELRDTPRVRFLHISDLHLGKTLRGRDLAEDQAFVLGQIVESIRRLRPDVLLIAGDVYDRSIPPVAAVRLFDSFLREAMEALPGLHIVAVPGNHDSGGRLGFAAGLLAGAGFHIRTDMPSGPEVVLERDGRKTAIWALPFLGQAIVSASVGETDGDDASSGKSIDAPLAGIKAPLAGIDAPGLRSQQELTAEAMRRIGPLLAPDATNILVAHCFAAGGMTGASERSFVGLAEQVDTSLFAGFDYVALGHLHRAQSPAPRIHYSGAPLAYDTGEAGQERGYLVVDIDGQPGTEPAIQFMPLTPLHAIRFLSGSFAEIRSPDWRPAWRNDYVDVLITDPEPVLNPFDALKAVYPNLLGVRQAAFEALAAGEADSGLAGGPAEEGPDAPPAGGTEAVRRDFEAFHRSMTGKAPDAALAQLFDTILGEANDASA